MCTHLRAVGPAVAVGYEAVWRRFLLVVLWAAGTAGATGVVFYAVSQMSSDLASVTESNADRPIPRAGSTTTTPRNEPTQASGAVEPTAVPTAAPATDAPTTTPLLTSPATSESEQGGQSGEPTVPPTVRPPTGTTRAPTSGTTVSTQAPVTTAPPVVTTPAPPPATTQPTAPPVTEPVTTVPQPSCNPFVQPVKRVGTISVRSCADGVHFVTASVVNATWSSQPLSLGPPSVTVRFVSTSGTTLTCTLTGGLEGVFPSGDC